MMMALAAFDIFILCLRMLQSTAAVLANLLTVICIIKYRSLRTPSGVLVSSLAVCDILHGLAMYTLPLRSLSSAWCIASLNAEGITMLAQVLSFILIAVERRNSLLAQLNRSKKWSVKKTQIILGLVWAGIVTWSLAFTLSMADPPESAVCNIMIYMKAFPRFFKIIHVLLYTGLSLTLLTAYLSIAQIVYKSSRQVSPNTSQTVQQRQRRQADMRITKMMALVVGVFCALYIPMMTSVATLTETPTMWRHMLHSISMSTSDINFWINPLIYAWRNKAFRTAFGNLFSGCCCACCTTSNDMVPHQGNQHQGEVMMMGALKPRRDIINVKPIEVRCEGPGPTPGGSQNLEVSTLPPTGISIVSESCSTNVIPQPLLHI